MKRPTQLYKNSTRLCVTLNIRGTPAYMSGLSVRLDRVGHGCVPKVCAPCPKNVFEDVQVQEEVVVPAVNSVTLPLIENRPDGSTCALITTELRDLEPGRYKVTVVGNDECDQCFSVDLLDSCGTVEAYSETPDGCITCDSAIPPPAPAPAPAPSPVPFPLESDTPFWDPSGTPLSPSVDVSVEARFHVHTEEAAFEDGMYNPIDAGGEPGTVIGAIYRNLGNVPVTFTADIWSFGPPFNPLTTINGGGSIITAGTVITSNGGPVDIAAANAADGPLGMNYIDNNDVVITLQPGGSVTTWMYSNLPYTSEGLDGKTFTASISGQTPTDTNATNDTSSVFRPIP